MQPKNITSSLLCFHWIIIFTLVSWSTTGNQKPCVINVAYIRTLHWYRLSLELYGQEADACSPKHKQWFLPQPRGFPHSPFMLKATDAKLLTCIFNQIHSTAEMETESDTVSEMIGVLIFQPTNGNSRSRIVTLDNYFVSPCAGLLNQLVVRIERRS